MYAPLEQKNYDFLNTAMILTKGSIQNIGNSLKHFYTHYKP